MNTEQLPRPLKLAIPLARVFTFFQLRYFMRNLRRVVESAARSEGPHGESRGAASRSSASSSQREHASH